MHIGSVEDLTKELQKEKYNDLKGIHVGSVVKEATSKASLATEEELAEGIYKLLTGDIVEDPNVF